MSYKYVRCANIKCSRFLGKEDIKLGSIAIKCPRCKTWTIIRVEKSEKVPEDTSLDIDKG